MQGLTDKGRRTRRSIIDNAVALFNEYGFDNVTIDCICKQANVSNGSFFHYFPEKAAILYAYVIDESEELEAMADTFDTLDAKKALEELVEWQAAYYEKKGCDFIAHFHSHLIVSRRGEVFEYAFVPVTEGLIERGQNEGLFRRDINPRFAAELLFSRIVSIATYEKWPAEGADATIADVIVRTYRQFYEQVLKTS